MNDLEQLEQAIAVLNDQRSLLGDAIIEAALAPMRERLALLQSQQPSVTEPQRNVTMHDTGPT